MNIDTEEIKRIVERMKARGQITVTPERRIVKEARPTYGETACHSCGTVFTRKAATAMYCRRECYLFEQKRERALAKSAVTPSVCPICSTQFVPKTLNNQTYCGPECNRKAQIARRNRIKA